jgi:hypothetical protein
MSNPSTSTRVRWFVLLVVPLGFFGGCVFEAGVGDPAEAKVERELAGYWAGTKDSDVWVIKATAGKNGKTYDVEFLSCKGTLAAPTEKGLHVVSDAWLAEIGKVTFVTAKVRMVNDAVPAKPYMVFKIQRSGDTLELTPLMDKFAAFAQAKTRAEMERAVRDNLENPEAYEGTEKFKPTTAEGVKKVLELFGRS